MAKKLNLDNIETEKLDTGIQSGEVFDNAESSGKSKSRQQGTASEEEKERRKAEGRTQGRKDCKLPRINMAFSESNYDYIKTMSRATGQSMTDFVNQIVTSYSEEHSDTYEKAKELLQELSGE